MTVSTAIPSGSGSMPPSPGPQADEMGRVTLIFGPWISPEEQERMREIRRLSHEINRAVRPRVQRWKARRALRGVVAVLLSRFPYLFAAVVTALATWWGMR